MSCVNIKHMSLISLYTEQLLSNGVEFDIIYMDKYNEDEDFTCSHKYRYVSLVGRRWPRLVKIFKYLKFVPYAKKILRRNKYDFVIVWNDVAIFLFADFLRRRYRGQYCLNVRDNMYYDKKVFMKRYERCFLASSFNTISSQAYLSFLPKQAEYFRIHSFNESVLNGMKQHDRLRMEGEPIRIGFIGYVRYFERNKKMLDVFANDPRFELHYYGAGASVLEEYAVANKIMNTRFHDSFPVADTPKYLEQIDIINNLYGNDSLNLRTAISIKFYHAMYAKIPILVNTETYIGELAHSLGFGYYVTNIDNDFKNQLYQWYHSLDFQALSEVCEKQLLAAKEDNHKLELLIQDRIIN